jgi:hypothetical protein
VAVENALAWRLVTSLLVQDGGWVGAGFNIAGFVVIGALAERLLGAPRWVVVAGASVAVAQAAALAWQPVVRATRSSPSDWPARSAPSASSSVRAPRPCGLPPS